MVVAARSIQNLERFTGGDFVLRLLFSSFSFKSLIFGRLPVTRKYCPQWWKASSIFEVDSETYSIPAMVLTRPQPEDAAQPGDTE